MTPPRSEASLDRRPEVLVEVPDGPKACALLGLLESRDVKVTWCPGPEGPPPSWCPLQGGHRCTLVESADLVVSALGFHNAACRQVLGELGSLHPEAKVIVEVPWPAAIQWAPLIKSHKVLPKPFSERALFKAVEEALARPVGVSGQSARR
jgi:hypothetical protein